MSSEAHIVGAGIAGLTAALCLEDKGFKVTISEKASQLQEIGAGLQLSPNASYILKKMGLLEACLKHGYVPQYINIIDGYNLKSLTKLPIAEYTKTQHLSPYLTIHRAHLQKILLEAALKRNININLNQKIEFLDKPTIVANGIWSNLRDDKAIFSGYVAWRLTIENKQKDKDVLVYLGKHNHIVMYPISQGKEYNIVCITPYEKTEQYWAVQQEKSKLLELFKDWHKDILEILSSEQFYNIWPIYTMSSIKLQEQNKIFIGDASHGFLPFAAQGASMAIEDAFALSKHYESRNFNAFATERAKRLHKVTKCAEANARIYHVSGLPRLMRNLVLKQTNPMFWLNRLNWLYNYKI